MSRISSGLDTVPADLALVYTTDDPAITPDGSLTIADGDGTLVTAEVMNAVEEIFAKVNAILAYLRNVSDDAV